MKTSELKGAALDWAVAKCEGMLEVIHDTTSGELWYYDREAGSDKHFWPTTDWSQAGPIIEREGIDLTHYYKNWGAYAWPNHSGEPWPTDYEEKMKRIRGKPASMMILQHGPTPLVAAMRCYVASKLGDEVEIPEGLGGVTA